MAANNPPPLDIDEDSVVSIKDIIDEERSLQETANAVLGDSDDTNCTYSKGYVSRQALYACATCNLPTSSNEPSKRGGFCLACSLKCHEGHELYELYTKRNFRCDCGNSLFPDSPCLLLPDKDPLNADNKYNHNFSGLYCSCNRPYLGNEDEVEDEMIQCIICEDWFHTRHLSNPPPDSYEEMVCDSCINLHSFLNAYKIHRIIDNNSVCSSKEIDVCENQSSTQPESSSNEPESSSKPDSAELNSKTESSSESKSSSNPESHSTSLEKLVSDKENISTNTEVPDCTLKEKLKMVNLATNNTTGFFMSGWRTELCGCGSCVKLYKDEQVAFLTDEEDTITSYEGRAHSMMNLEEAGMDAMSTTMGRVQQVEMIHGYNSMKEELYQFLKGFSENNKVVRSRDIEDFFGELQDRKRRRLESGEGIPPNSCH